MTKDEYNKRKVEDLSKKYPGATVRVIERGGGKAAMTPAPGEVLYIKATGGTWGRASEVRVGVDVAKRKGLDKSANYPPRLREKAIRRGWF